MSKLNYFASFCKFVVFWSNCLEGTRVYKLGGGGGGAFIKEERLRLNFVEGYLLDQRRL